MFSPLLPHSQEDFSKSYELYDSLTCAGATNKVPSTLYKISGFRKSIETMPKQTLVLDTHQILLNSSAYDSFKDRH